MKSKFSNKPYLYNTGTHTLHVNGGCAHGTSPELVGFDSEDEAVKANGRELGMCKICMKYRDDLVRNALNHM